MILTKTAMSIFSFGCFISGFLALAALTLIYLVHSNHLLKGVPEEIRKLSTPALDSRAAHENVP